MNELKCDEIDDKSNEDDVYCVYLFASDVGEAVGERLGEDDVEYGVRARRFAVHVGGGHRSRLVSLLHQHFDVLVGGDGQLGQTVHVRTQNRMFAHFQRLFVGTRIE